MLSKVMTVRQRWVFILAITAFCLFIPYHLQYIGPDDLRALSPGHRPQTPFYTPPPKIDDGRFRWADLPVRYPVTSFIPLPTGTPKRLPRVQHTFRSETGEEARVRHERLAAVTKTFDRCWSSYKTRAWMRDELAPVSGAYRDTFGGWAATLVDTLDTLWIMGKQDEFKAAVDAVLHIDFTSCTDSQINIFETTIRYLGGLLSAYDLSNDKRLLDKAVEVGEMLYISFDTPNRMPLTRWDFQAGRRGEEQPASDGALVSEIGSLSVEFTRLSQVTGDAKYFDAIERITTVFDAQQDQTKLPGMWPVLVNARNANFTEDTGFTLGGMSDSLYEYFPKEYALLGGLSPVYEKLYKKSMKTAIEDAFFRPMTPDNHDILVSGNVRADSPTRKHLEPKSGHLTCFAAGMMALGGRLFSLPDHVAIGQKLIQGCIYLYGALPLGIMPETFELVPCLPSSTSCTLDLTTWHSEVLKKHGTDMNHDANLFINEKRLPPGFVDIMDRRYILRPEALESVFILYRITGDRSLMDSAWQMFQSIEELTITDLANAEIEDITVKEASQVRKADRMESFWMAETLKYLYLLFSEPDLISLDEWVFNTEAHPFRRPV